MIPIANPVMGAEEREAVTAVLDSGNLASGDEVQAFEREFAEYHGAEHGVATSNGTTALHTAFVALGLEPGTTVVTSPFSFIASANAARLAGHEVAFGDIDPKTFNLDPDSVETILRQRDDVSCVMPVHLYGLQADMPRFRELADEYDVALLEDAAQAHGSEFDGRPAGHYGDAACFSFYPTKNMTTGEGGLVLTDDDEVAARAREYINHGRPAAGGYEHVSVGHNFRLTNVAAAIGRVQLRKLPEYTEARRSNARTLDQALASTSVRTPGEPEGCTHVYHQYTVRSDRRDELNEFLTERDVGTGVYYPTPIHRQAPYADADPSAPNAEAAAEEVLSLPVHPTVSAEDVERIAAAVAEFDEVKTRV